MAVDMFLKLDDIKGESQDDKHKDEIDVLAWSWGMSRTGTLQSGGGAGKVSVNDISITKYLDKASPGMMLSCCNGKHYKQAMLTVRKAGERPLEYLKLTMKEVIISSVTAGGSGGEDSLTENVALNFGEYKIEYTPQKPDGSPDAVVQAGWNIRKNQKV